MNGYDPRTLADVFLLHQEEKVFLPQMETIRQHWRDALTLASRQIVWDTLPNLSSDHLPRFERGDLVWHFIPQAREKG